MTEKDKLEVYEHNIEVLKKTNFYLWENLQKETEDKKENANVYMDISLKEEPIVAMEKGDHLWYFNSRYHAKESARIWAGEEELVYAAPLVVFGFANGDYVEGLRKQYPENVILVYEPSMAIFSCVLKNMDLSEILSDDLILICVGESGLQYFSNYLAGVTSKFNFQHTLLKILPNYERIFLLEFLKMKKLYMHQIQSFVVGRNTAIIFEEGFVKNHLQNIWSALSSYTINDLKVKFIEKMDVEKYPAIVVSGGPSLDKNINDLKKAKHKAYIIVVDTALKTVLRAGIIPDITVTVDPMKPAILFEDERIKHLPMVVYTRSNQEILHKHQGRKFFIGESDGYQNDIYKNYKKTISGLEVGGSVADVAFSLARFIGFRNIILIGQDLAYPENKTHTKSAYEKFRTIDTSSTRYYEVEDIYGNMVWTEDIMDKYRRWFEQQILQYPELKVMDATEGGAKIRGAEIITLREAIERECQGLETVYFDKLTEEVAPCFTDVELKEIRTQLEDIPNELELMKEVLETGMEQYETLKELAKDVTKNAREIKLQIGDINETITWLNEKNEMKLVRFCNETFEYEGWVTKLLQKI